MADLAVIIAEYVFLPLLLVLALVLTCSGFFGNQDQADAQRPETSAQPPPVEAAQMACIVIDLLEHVTYPRQSSAGSASDSAPAGTGGGDPSAETAGTPSASEDCAICLGTFEDGDWCSIMPVCRHEFHKACIVGWLMTCNNSCPLCRAQLKLSAIAQDMV